MITIREYAAKHDISYEAVRKQLRRFEKELEGHISRQNGTQFLDEEAEAILDAHRQPRVMAIETQNEEAKQALLAAHEEIRRLQQEIIALQDERGRLQLSAAKVELLEEKNKGLEELQARSDQLHQEQINTLEQRNEQIEKLLQAQLDDMRAQRDAAQEESRSYQKSIFGLYRKK